MKKKYSEYLFWASLFAVWVNFGLLCISAQLQNQALMTLNLASMALCAVGAGINLYLDEKR